MHRLTKMKELKGICKKAIEEGKCLGCTGLAEIDWIEPKECPYIDKEEQISLWKEQKNK